METKLYISKDDERKGLEKIRKIVEGLGGINSYVGMAFEGVWELAERNIREDAGYSCKEYIVSYDSLESEMIELKKQLVNCENENRELNGKLDNAYDDLKREKEYREIKLSEKDSEVESLQVIINQNNQEREQNVAKITELEQEKKAVEKENDNLREEIIRLKAKLYDFIV